MQVSRTVVRSLVSRNAAFISRTASYHDEHHKPTTMNDMYVPEGDWQEKHQQKQSKYNAILAGSILLFAGVCGFIKQSGAVNFNYSPPATYE